MASPIIEWLEKDARQYPEKVAFADADESLTYRALMRRAQAVGTRLAFDAYPGAYVAILLPRGVGQVVCMLAAAYANRPYVMLDDAAPLTRQQAIVSQLGTCTVIACAKTAATAKVLSVHAPLSYETASHIKADCALLEDIQRRLDPESILYTLFTSGSTGTPKGVMVSHANVEAYTQWFTSEFGICPDTVFGSQTPLYFSMSVSDVYGTLRTGATLHLIPKTLFSFPAALVEFLNDRQVNTLYWVPTALALFVKWDVFSCMQIDDLELVMFAGEAMPAPVLNYWARNNPGARFANLFGPTETTDICAFYKVDRAIANDESVPVGVACKGCDLVVVTEDGREAQPGEEGELYAGGPFVAKGYLGNPEKTEAAFVQHPLDPTSDEPFYRTGDIVRVGEDGVLRYVGRRDFQIKRRGYRIELGEIETAARACVNVDSCAATCTDPKGQITLFCAGRKLKTAALAKELKRRVPSYMMPDRIEVMPRLPLNQNGKMDRKALSSYAAVA